MGLFNDLFETAVDVVAAPARIVTAVTDEVLDTDLTDSVDNVVEKVKGRDSE